MGPKTPDLFSVHSSPDERDLLDNFNYRKISSVSSVPENNGTEKNIMRVLIHTLNQLH